MDKIRITKDDLFTYFIQRNLWPTDLMFDDFVERLKEHGVEVIEDDTRETNTEQDS